MGMAKKYTAKMLDNMNIRNAKVIYGDNSADFFDNIEFGVIDYLYNGHKDDASVIVHNIDKNGKCNAENWNLCDFDMFLDILNGGNKVILNAEIPKELNGCKVTPKTYKGFKTATYGRKGHRDSITQLENSVRKMF